MRDAMGMGWDERTVTVDRMKLLETLKKNRTKHKQQYSESVAGYRDAARKELAKKVVSAKRAIDDSEAMLLAKIDRFDPDDPLPDQVVVVRDTSFKLAVPQDHTKSYDVAIQMAEWEVSENIELTQSQFQCFVMDDWDWKQEFTYLNKSYTAAR